MNFFRDHALAFHNGPAVFGLADGQNLPECTGSIFGPDYLSATSGESLFKTFELLVEGLEGPPFDIFGSFPGQVKIVELLFPLILCCFYPEM